MPGRIPTSNQLDFFPELKNPGMTSWARACHDLGKLTPSAAAAQAAAPEASAPLGKAIPMLLSTPANAGS